MSAPMIEFSCHTWGFSDLTLPESLGTIARLGFRYVDIGSGHGWNVLRAANPATRADAIRELQHDLATFNLKIADFYVMLPRISLNDEQKRTTDLQLFRALMPFMKAIGARGITISAGVVHGEDDPEALDRTIVSLRDMVKSAQSINCPISIEPHVDSMVQTPEQALAMLKQVQGLQLTLDWAQIVYQKGIKLDDAFALLPHTRHMHIRQAHTSKLQLAHDKGQIDLSALMHATHEAHYDGIICIESMAKADQYGSKAVNPLTEARMLRDELRALR